jgi:tRNA uridine 5-carbamoylmethylation protein Kti12
VAANSVEAILLIGIPGSGKSSFYKERFYGTHLRINRDMLKTRQRERALIETCLKITQRFVLDKVNATRSDRSDVIVAAHAARFRVIGYFFQISTRVAVARNKERSGKAQIPLVGIFGAYKRLEPPSRAEGFDELFVVTIAADRKFMVNPAPQGPLDKAPPCDRSTK